MEELFYTCPYCFSGVSILADLSLPEQEYIEDCERCCNPIEFKIIAENLQLVSLEAEPLGQ
ncbi:MAG: CPXCG motif-containing cysteine-rich protein [Bacteroidetes bacterium]|nr:CPXCG motif-containing cysteine-rich protein [Bacteroidota bacterium]